MGEAKRRGTYEQRRAEGIAKRLALIEAAKKVIEAKEKEQSEYWKSLSLKEKKELIEMEAFMMMLTSGAFGAVTPERLKMFMENPDEDINRLCDSFPRQDVIRESGSEETDVQDDNLSEISDQV